MNIGLGLIQFLLANFRVLTQIMPPLLLHAVVQFLINYIKRRYAV